MKTRGEWPAKSVDDQAGKGGPISGSAILMSSVSSVGWWETGFANSELSLLGIATDRWDTIAWPAVIWGHAIFCTSSSWQDAFQPPFEPAR